MGSLGPGFSRDGATAPVLLWNLEDGRRIVVAWSGASLDERPIRLALEVPDH